MPYFETNGYSGEEKKKWREKALLVRETGKKRVTRGVTGQTVS
jgi:hypothetical protein